MITATLIIFNDMTADLDGVPVLPPEGEGWHVIERADGATRWRRIALVELSDQTQGEK